MRKCVRILRLFDPSINISFVLKITPSTLPKSIDILKKTIHDELMTLPQHSVNLRFGPLFLQKVERIKHTDVYLINC